MALTSAETLPNNPAFEREKWQAELRLRERELSLKERNQTLKRLELRLKQKDDRRSQWFNPLAIAVFTAALAAAGNTVVAYINGTKQLKSEDSKAEGSRILQVIKTNDVDKAKTNLERATPNVKG